MLIQLAGVIWQIVFLTLAWVLMGVLEEAAEDKMKDVDSLIHTLPQNFCQLCQVLPNMLL